MKKSTKGLMVAAAAAALFIAGCATQPGAGTGSSATHSTANGCKGMSSCKGMSRCKGMGSCKGKNKNTCKANSCSGHK